MKGRASTRPAALRAFMSETSEGGQSTTKVEIQWGKDGKLVHMNESTAAAMDLRREARGLAVRNDSGPVRGNTSPPGGRRVPPFGSAL